MATTANGQKVLFDARTSGAFPRLRKWKIPGTDRHLLLRDGAMGFLLVHVALWFHEKLERLNLSGQPWDEWGWAVRPVRGQTSGFSNHAGGVAEDLNATLHPRGVPASRTFTTKQIRAIKLRVRFYRGCIIWGGEWRTPDGMHFEIAPVSLAKCERVAKWLMKTPRGRRILAANPGAKEAILS